MKNSIQVQFTQKFERWLNNYSQSVAIDMPEGGHDKGQVAETTLTCLPRDLESEYATLVKQHGYDAVLKAAEKFVAVRTRNTRRLV